MRDPIDELENFSTPGLPMNPLPASEVRRRGTRMRRRNHALATIGAVAAVAVIATPIALAANGGPNGSSAPTPGPAAQPSGGWRQTIPPGFDLGALPENATYRFTVKDQGAVGDITLCDTSAFSTSDGPAGAAVDVQGASYLENESQLARTLAVYPTDAEAEAALDGLRQGVADCPQEQSGNGTLFVNDAVDVAVPGAEDAFVFTNQVKDGDLLSQMTAYEVTQVGNALYLATSYGDAGGEQAMDNVDQLVGDSAPVVEQLCSFSVEGCDPARPDASDAVDGATGLSGSIPDDFPLEQGLPTGGDGVGLEGPSHDLDLAVYNLENSLQACGVAPERLPEPVDTLSAGHRSPATGILRQLMTFDSAADAERYAENLMAPFANCPEDADGRGVTKVYDVTGEDAGDQASSAVMRVEVEGEPGPGFQIVQVVRVGQAVLQTVVISEEEPSQTLDELRTTYLEDSQSVIDAMGA